LDTLLDLQDHDLALDRLRHRRATLAVRAELAAAEADVAALRRRVAEVQGPANDIAREQERLEAEAQSLADQAAVMEKRLYSGETNSPKELQAMQADIAQIRKHQSVVEERALEVMERREPLDAELAKLAAAASDALGRVEAARAALASEEAALDLDLAAEQQVRDGVAATVDAAVLALYDRCRANAPSGIGVARLVGVTCQGCHLTVPATEAEQIRKGAGTVAHCDNCGCILVP
jgi:predicted  nucleic acid-binding Zn-ribbon protein